MSPALARALRELFKGEHKITYLAEKFPRDISDVDWISNLSKDGHWIVVSGDRRITRNRAEYHAFRNSNLIGLFKAPVVKQMERILALWLVVLTIAATVQGGAMYELLMKSTKLRQLKI